MDNNIIEIIKNLPSLKSTGGVNESEINNAESELGLKFAADYRTYLAQFGQIRAKGVELTGISTKKLTSVVNNTVEARKYNSIPQDMYVIEDIGVDGLLYAQNTSGSVYELMPRREPKLYSNSLAEYVKSTQQ